MKYICKKNKVFTSCRLMLTNFLFVMRLTTIMVLLFTLSSYANSNAQYITLKKSNIPLKSLLKEITKQSNYHFLYDDQLMSDIRVDKINLSKVSIDDALSEILKNQALKYEKIAGTIIITEAAPPIRKSLVQESIEISGRVFGNSGEALPGVSISLKGKSSGMTSTDSQGVFKITASPSDIIMFRMLGYESQELAVRGRTQWNIQLIEAEQAISEVIVTSLGIKKDVRALGYSATEVQGEDFTKARETNVANSLAGKVAGVSVSKPVSGSMGSSRVVIRGNGSISGYNQPLYVVDGIPIVNTNYGQSSVYYGGSDGGDGISSINPDDILSITVLKGGPAAALYGARASNGAILITTKDGKSQKGLGVEYNSSYTLDKPIFRNKKDFQYEYGQGVYGVGPSVAEEALQMGIASWGPKLDGSSVVQFDGESRPYSAVKDNVQTFYNNGNTFSNSVAFLAGTETAHMRFAVADLNNHDLMPNSSLKRNNYSLNGGMKVGENLNIQISSMYIRERVKNRPNSGDFSWNPHLAVQLLPTNYDVESLSRRVDENGNEFLFSDDIYWGNPYFLAYDNVNQDKKDRIIASADIRYDFTPHLYARLLAGTDYAYRYREAITPEGSAISSGGMSAGQGYNSEFNSQLILGFNKELNPDFSLDTFIGGNIMKNRSSNMSVSGDQFIVPNFYAINNTRTQGRGYSFYEKDFNSLFASAEFGYKNLLYLTVTGRNDWFSTLSKNSNRIFYPSASSSFILSDVVDLPSGIDFVKLRGAWARTGSDSDISPYAQSLTYRFGQQIDGNALAYINESTIPNTNLKPATSNSYEAGFDLNFLKNRLGIDFTWYNRKTINDILSSEVSITSGFNNVRINSGVMQNKGVELLLNTVPIRQEKFSWHSSFNMGYNSNKVVSLADGQQEMTLQQSRPGLYGDGGVPVYITAQVGKPFGLITGTSYERDGKGNIVFDPYGLPVVGEIKELGYSVSPWTMGFSNELRYGNVSLNMLIDAKFGGSINSATNNFAYLAGLSKNTLEGREDGVVGQGVTADGNANTSSVAAQDYYGYIGNTIAEEFVYDASFIKLHQIALGIDLPKSWLNQIKVQNASISIVGRNLWLIHSKIPLVDPESSFLIGNIQGLEMLSLPAARSFGLNLNIKF